MNFYGDPPPSPPPGPPGPPVPKLTMKIKTAAWAPAPASDPMMDASSSEYEDNYHYSPASASAQVPQSQSEKRNYRKRITSFITDKQLRLRSYIRRRPIPFKRTQEIDTQIGTKSLIIQICRDFDECLYWGHPELVKYFLRDEGLRFTDTDSIVRTSKFPPPFFC